MGCSQGNHSRDVVVTTSTLDQVASDEPALTVTDDVDLPDVLAIPEPAELCVDQLSQRADSSRVEVAQQSTKVE